MGIKSGLLGTMYTKLVILFSILLCRTAKLSFPS